MPHAINKDTKVCMSLAGRPGNTGTRFHNHLYEALGLNYLYKAFTTTDLPAAIGGIRALGIRGCAISMPFKEDCIKHLDGLDPSAAVIDSVNTIVNDDGTLTGYNTDFLAVASLLETHKVSPDLSLALRGSGGMAKAVAFALREAGFKNGTIVARNPTAGRALADACGYTWVDSLTDQRPELIINVTPIGMAGGPEAQDLSFADEVIQQAKVVFDVVAMPSETPLIKRARELGKPVITGAEVVALQALEQFVLYTGIRPEPEQVEAAAAYSRAQ
ncbi:shikimate 5-dehydrogenase [Pseudomonas asuensis]|uniref:Shikimate 5-dehydrogenase n=1 Tax=Pseudomonas asuensis TaxID=1825787 RepID=A0ABQ2GKP0_9PSED|nr:shikimate 5-dehydrogenase [Pseudomonas asuensis]GGM01012.1 shikimate 5-dehydrogenase [Pseudomonas asuensis]